MKLKNNVIVLETSISDKVLTQIKEMKNEHPDKEAVITACVKMIKRDYPEIEIFEVGPNYIITESRMYLAMFEDEIEMT